MMSRLGYTKPGIALRLALSQHNVVQKRDVSSVVQDQLPLIEVNHEGDGSKVTLTGYGYDDVNRFAIVDAFKVARHNEACGMLLFRADEFASGESNNYNKARAQIFKDGFVFLVASVYNFKPALYDNMHLYNNVQNKERIVNIGRSTYDNQISTASLKTGEVLHESLIKFVFVDKKTRKPAQIPEYFRSISDAKVSTDNVEALTKPAKTYITKYRVVWSDADLYRHTNQGALIRICMDGIVEVGMRGVLTTLTGDIGRYWIKTLKCLYQKEASPKDELDIHVWQNGSNPYIVHSVLEKKGVSIFQMTSEFTEPQPKPKL